MSANKICIAIVTNRLIKPKTVLSLANMITATTHDIFTVVATEGYTIAENRNYCAIQAIKNNCTHLLFIDDDMIFPEDTIEKLLATGKDIVGVNSHSRKLPLVSTVGQMDENGEYLPYEKQPPWHKMPTELFQCYSIGFGVVLINMKVLDVIDKPWFQFKTYENGMVEMGEDHWFCNQAKEKGFTIWCEPTLSIGHIGEYIY